MKIFYILCKFFFKSLSIVIIVTILAFFHDISATFLRFFKVSGNGYKLQDLHNERLLSCNVGSVFKLQLQRFFSAREEIIRPPKISQLMEKCDRSIVNYHTLSIVNYQTAGLRRTVASYPDLSFGNRNFF